MSPQSAWAEEMEDAPLPVEGTGDVAPPTQEEPEPAPEPVKPRLKLTPRGATPADTVTT